VPWSCANVGRILLSDAFTIWCTGLPASGKLALAEAVAAELQVRALSVEVISSGQIRRAASGEPLGFTREERDANVRQHADVAQQLMAGNVVAVVAAVSPFRSTRDEVRAQLGDFVEVHVSTPRATCIDRDKHGAWLKALEGDIRNFTGVDAPYEAPAAPDVEVDLSELSTADGAGRVLAALERLGRLSAARSQ